MTKLVLDLRTYATRNSILEQITSSLSKDDQAKIQHDCASAGISPEHHKNIVVVREAINAMPVSERVKQDMQSIYQILAEAEAHAHNCPVDSTHFHEVGNGEAIKNALEICLAFERLAPATVVASPVQTGEGTITCSHGELNIPAPATAAIIARGIPTCKNTLPGERCTPTSAAIIYHFVNEYLSEEES